MYYFMLRSLCLLRIDYSILKLKCALYSDIIKHDIFNTVKRVLHLHFNYIFATNFNIKFVYLSYKYVYSQYNIKVEVKW